MEINDIPLALTGDRLIEAMGKSKDKRKAIAEGLLYEQTINMIAADPGTGKSTISTQACIELSAGFPIFGVFHVPKPVKTFYIQTERGIIEFLERIEHIGKIMPIVKENIVVTDEYQRFNLLKSDSADLFIKCVLRDYQGAEIIFIDPIYSMVAGGLKEDAPASAFTKVMSNLQKATGAILWYNHHTVKQQYQNGKPVDRADPFYGSQWLKAHVTGSFYLSERTGGVKLEKKKDNYGLLPNLIELDYDSETGLCSIPDNDMPSIEKIRMFLRARDEDKKTFYFNDISTSTKLSHRTLRRLLCHTSISSRLIVVSNSKNKNLYKTALAQESCAVPKVHI